uniref:Estrogen receptor alpha n=1 Tax=Petromyzon marinus TaxID=7757 RepID=A0A1I9VZF4_PETMA|nr:estrogen receptor alpha [Petromyzon marinus]
MMSTPLPPLPPPSAAQWLHPGSSPHPPGQVFFREPGWHSGSPSPKPAEHVFSIHRSSSDPEAPEAGGGSCTGGRGPGGCEPVSGGSTCSSPTAAVSPRSLRETHYCAVCSDLASGYHYGVWSCEGCKAFFKRSIQGKTNYICPATNQCTIDKNRRKSCQACRLRKCHEVGMVRDACRRDRRGGGGALRGPAGAAARNPAQNPPNHKRSCSETDSATGRPSPAPAAASPEAPECKRNPSEPPAVNQMLTSLMEAEPPKVLSLQESKQPFSEASLMNVLTNLADRELVHMITWAKKIPGFTAIGLSDQVQLLECCWLEILIVGLIWRSIDRPGQLHFAPNLILGREDARNVEGMLDMFDMLLVTVSRFRELHLRREEYVCLKAMILLNSGVFFCLSNSAGEQTNVQLIQQILEKVMDALGSTIGHIEASPPQHSRRLSQLLLLLSQIRHISNKGIEHLNSMKRKNVIPLYDLLLELLDAHSLQNTGLRTSPPPQDFRATSNGDGDVAAQPGEQEYHPYVAADFKALHQPESREFRTHADRPYLGGGHANRGPVATVIEPEVRPQHEREFRVHTQRGFRDHVEREFITLGKSNSASSEAGGPVTFTSKSLMF